MDQGATWHEGRPQPRRLCVRWGPSPLPTKGVEPPKISAHIYCGQTAAWIKMPLGTEVGLEAYETLCSMWTQLPPEKGHTQSHPIFGTSVVAKWLDG